MKNLILALTASMSLIAAGASYASYSYSLHVQNDSNLEIEIVDEGTYLRKIGGHQSANFDIKDNGKAVEVRYNGSVVCGPAAFDFIHELDAGMRHFNATVNGSVSMGHSHFSCRVTN